MADNSAPADQQADNGDPADKENRNYKRAARLLAQKLGVDWRELPAEQVIEYMRKIEIARQKPDSDKGR
ncbi:MAG: hypothetical protein ABI700_12845 [Chloroflexota bacterium]